MAFVYHRQLGAGSPLVLIHGFCETHQIWDDLAVSLSQDFTVFVPDLPGFGRSQSLPSVFTLDDVADTMLLWLHSLTTQPVVVIGHSLGGYVAMAMAAKHPLAFAGVGLFHSTASADTEEKRQNRNKTIDFVRENGIKPFVDVFVPGLFYQKANPHINRVRQMAQETPLETLIGYTVAMRDRPARENWLRTFQNNFLILAGDQDPIIPINSLKIQSALGSKTIFCELPHVGHMGMFEAPSEATQTILRFAFGCFKGQAD